MIDGFKPLKMMPPPMAADDVSADAEMMLFAIAHNDAMFALMCPQAHIIAAGNIMCGAHIICPVGQTSFKNAAQSLRFWSLTYRTCGSRPTHTTSKGTPQPKRRSPARPPFWKRKKEPVDVKLSWLLRKPGKRNATGFF